MISFESDYVEGAHPKILESLLKTNMEQLPGYGADIYSQRAAEKIRAACGRPEAEVFFLCGGTQANQVVIASLLRTYEGVIAAETGHIGTHEAGAIEYSGHKVITLPSHEGKLDAEELGRYLESFFRDENREHMVFPGMVYISYPTEFGTLYTKGELAAIRGLCGAYGIPLYLDGARLGYGLMSRRADVTLRDIAALCDVFYIGGTKVGALMGEAVVFSGRPAPAHFPAIVKQHGALPAKGRILGVQFDTLFTDDLYFRISRHAAEMAERLKALFLEKGYRLFLDSPTNQQFVILDNTRMEALRREVRFSFWQRLDEDHCVVRFAASWATTEESLAELERLL